METTKLYQKDVYLKEWEARVIQTDGDAGVVLDRTAFFPEGGGQSCDLGTIGGWQVTDVQERDGQVYHTLDPAHPPADQAPFPKEGDPLSCRLDWNRRFDNMQRHCGEHILSGIFFREYGGVNRGFHMGRDYMTVDISLEENPVFTEITEEMALHAELLANRVIWSDAPVTTIRFESRQEAEKMPLRKALALDEDITIVSVGSIDNAADCVACCGTHPATAGQVGLLKIYKVEKYKGMFRIYFEAGQRALEDYDGKHRILTELAGRYSSSIEDFPEKLRAQEEKLAAAKNELFHIKKAYTDFLCGQVDALLAGGDDAGVAATDDAAGGSDSNGAAGKPGASGVPRATDAGGAAAGNSAGGSDSDGAAGKPGASGVPSASDADGATGGSKVMVYTPPGFSLDDAFQMAKRYMGTCPTLLLLYSEKDTSYALASDGTLNCGALVKEYASFYQGKGGGNDVSARAIFNSEENARLFADLLQKHLRP